MPDASPYEALADRIVEVIEGRLENLHPALRSHAVTLLADRERIASDLDGLRKHNGLGDRDDCTACWMEPAYCDDHNRYANGLRRTARVYEVNEPSANGDAQGVDDRSSSPAVVAQSAPTPESAS